MNRALEGDHIDVTGEAAASYIYVNMIEVDRKLLYVARYRLSQICWGWECYSGVCSYHIPRDVIIPCGIGVSEYHVDFPPTPLKCPSLHVTGRWGDMMQGTKFTPTLVGCGGMRNRKREIHCTWTQHPS